MDSEEQFAREVLAMWTDTDPGRRSDVLQRYFHEDVRFHDPDGEFIGPAGLEEFSQSLRNRFPQARFTLTDTPWRVGDALRFTWSFGPVGERETVTGMDFVVLSEGKVSRLYAFVNQPG
jgi:hypothetical protein